MTRRDILKTSILIALLIPVGVYWYHFDQAINPKMPPVRPTIELPEQLQRGDVIGFMNLDSVWVESIIIERKALKENTFTCCGLREGSQPNYSDCAINTLRADGSWTYITHIEIER